MNRKWSIFKTLLLNYTINFIYDLNMMHDLAKTNYGYSISAQSYDFCPHLIKLDILDFTLSHICTPSTCPFSVCIPFLWPPSSVLFLAPLVSPSSVLPPSKLPHFVLNPSSFPSSLLSNIHDYFDFFLTLQCSLDHIVETLCDI